MRYSVVLSSKADRDYTDYINTIMYCYSAPLTAAQHYKGLYSALKSLETNPESYPIATQKSLLLQYGYNTRRINYKKMTIIYTVHSDMVYVHRVIPASMITGL